MNKNLHTSKLIILFIFAIILFSPVLVFATTVDTGDCLKLDNKNEQIKCIELKQSASILVDVAFKENNPNSCILPPDPGHYGNNVTSECIIQLAILKNDINLCDNKELSSGIYPYLYSGTGWVECKIRFALATNDKEICESSLGSEIALCNVQFAIRDNNVDGCFDSSVFSYGGVEEFKCVRDIVNINQNPELCRELKNRGMAGAKFESYDYYDRCVADYAETHSDSTLCEKMLTGEAKDECIRFALNQKFHQTGTVNASFLSFLNKCFYVFLLIFFVSSVVLMFFAVLNKVSFFVSFNIMMFLSVPVLVFGREIFKVKDLSYSIAGGDANIHSLLVLIFGISSFILTFYCIKSAFILWLRNVEDWWVRLRLSYFFSIIFAILISFITVFNYEDNRQPFTLLSLIGKKFLAISGNFIFIGSSLLFFLGWVYLYYAIKSRRIMKTNEKKKFLSFIIPIVFILIGAFAAFWVVFFWIGGEPSM